MEESLFYKSPNAIISSVLNQLHSSTMMKKSLSTAASSSFSSSVVSSLLHRNPRSVDSIITLYSNRSLSSGCSGHFKPGDDVKDLGRGGDLAGTQKKIEVPKPFVHQFRKNKILSVSNITAWEWCGKQAEFELLNGKRKVTAAMKEGIARHRQLAKKVSKKVVKRTKIRELYWAFYFLDFIIGANELSLEGLTRELPILGIFEDVWIVGIIDEIRMPVMKTIQNPSLVDTKTRQEATLPNESQIRNGRLQLMCYKYLWDNAVTNNFPTDQFFNYFHLNPGYILPQNYQKSAANVGCPAKTLGELVKVYKSTCCTLSPANNQLILRYEYQKDYSLLDEVHFTYDSDWLRSLIKGCVKFMLGEQEASYVSKEDRRKCDSCPDASKCPSKTNKP